MIANPVYDPTRPLEFVVIGEFDVNRDGIPDRGGKATIESLIKDWGGRVSEEVSAGTDFVVVGKAPRLPRPGIGASPDQQDVQQARQREWDAYQAVRSEAEALSLPILTYDVFMNFLGGDGDRYSRR